MKKISLLGAGGMAREIISWIDQDSPYQIEYLYANIIKEKRLKGCPVSNIFLKDNYYLIAVGYPEIKIAIINSINYQIKWANPFIHSFAVVGQFTNIGKGSVVCPFVTLTSDIEIGPLATINSGVTISHNCKIGSMFHASSGAVVSGNVTIGDRVFLGTNSCIKEKISIYDDVIIGAGSVVIRNIKEKGIYVGNPIRKL